MYDCEENPSTARKDEVSTSRSEDEWNLTVKLGSQRKRLVVGTQERGRVALGRPAYSFSRPGLHPTGTLVSGRKQWTEYMGENKTTAPGNLGNFNVGRELRGSRRG